MNTLNAFLEPGMFVQHPSYPEWGTGQVQSNIGDRITVNFPETGKVTINGNEIMLLQVFPSDDL